MAASDTSPDAARLLRTRGLRAFVDGLVAVVLPTYLLARGLSPTQVGAVITATLLGSAAVTLTIALRGGRFDRVHLLQLMAGADDRDRAGLRDGGGVRGPARRGGGRARSTRRSATSAPSCRSSRRCSPTRCRPSGAPTSSPATAWWRRWPAPSARWRPACRSGWPTTPTSPSSTPSAACSSFYALVGRRAAPVLPAAGAAADGRRRGPRPQRARALEGDRAAAVRAVQRRRLRRRLRGAVDPRAVVGAPPRPVDGDRRRGVLLERAPDGQLRAAGAGIAAPDRADPHDGVHARARQPAADRRRR